MLTSQQHLGVYYLGGFASFFQIIPRYLRIPAQTLFPRLFPTNNSLLHYLHVLVEGLTRSC